MQVKLPPSWNDRLAPIAKVGSPPNLRIGPDACWMSGRMSASADYTKHVRFCGESRLSRTPCVRALMHVRPFASLRQPGQSPRCGPRDRTFAAVAKSSGWRTGKMQTKRTYAVAAVAIAVFACQRSTCVAALRQMPINRSLNVPEQIQRFIARSGRCLSASKTVRRETPVFKVWCFGRR